MTRKNRRNLNVVMTLVGVIAFSELQRNNWWKENNSSLILTADPIIEDVEIRKLKKKSLELAGIV